MECDCAGSGGSRVEDRHIRMCRRGDELMTMGWGLFTGRSWRRGGGFVREAWLFRDWVESHGLRYLSVSARSMALVMMVLLKRTSHQKSYTLWRSETVLCRPQVASMNFRTRLAWRFREKRSSVSCSGLLTKIILAWHSGEAG